MKDKVLTLEVAALLLFAKLGIVCLSFKKLMWFLGELMEESADIIGTSQQEQKVRKIRRFIKVIAPHMPFESVCFDQAITAMIMLNRRQIDATIYFGVANGEPASLKAHAWVRSGQYFVTGGNGAIEYQTVAYFS